ncbi:MAG: tRNA (adenosine(37)-N6)-threonylcarbamoyltransferase complex ATPase subunit type 1 TsaE [Campylobacteraceae bacterium]|jgi:tRNA threonylcarbamoyladenosine biosynthesis protein TsaE|nr:tRNA (adenosine(37)-N6)-threonylcarbamoyltransferase complex ATPase subunit type 1 TsaE [Campylobacteraceae bacterium]
MIEIVLAENELDILVDKVYKLLPDGGIVLLRGNLGSGKTTLVKSFAEVLHIDKNIVFSPTFSIMNRYGDDFFHYDVYNNGVNGLIENGLFENFQENGYHFVEWGDEKLENLLNEYGFSYIIISIDTENAEKNRRLYKVLNA